MFRQRELWLYSVDSEAALIVFILYCRVCLTCVTVFRIMATTYYYLNGISPGFLYTLT